MRIIKGKIKLKYAPEHGPHSTHDLNLLVHEIGSTVREKGSMDTPSFYDEMERAMKIIISQ